MKNYHHGNLKEELIASNQKVDDITAKHKVLIVSKQKVDNITENLKEELVS